MKIKQLQKYSTMIIGDKIIEIYSIIDYMKRLEVLIIV